MGLGRSSPTQGDDIDNPLCHLAHLGQAVPAAESADPRDGRDERTFVRLQMIVTTDVHIFADDFGSGSVTNSKLFVHGRTVFPTGADPMRENSG